MKREAFLASFFGEGNLIDWAQVQATPQLSELVSDVTDDLEVPVVLPRRTGPEEVEWFVACGDDTSARRAQAEVQAFVGPTYARWDGVRAHLLNDDPVERSLIDFAGGRVIRFKTETNAEFKDCWAAINLMRSVWRQRPADQHETVRTGASLVRGFELAIAAGDSAGSAACLAEVRSRGLLGAENLRFLEIRQLAAEGRWRDIAEASDLADLARIRRPWLVTEDLLTAVYRTTLASFESPGDVRAAVDAMTALVDALPGLFATRGPLRSADVTKVFALRHAVSGSEDQARIRELLEDSNLAATDQAWIAAIADAIAPRAVPERHALQALAAGDLDAALALALAEDPTPKRAQVLIECAFELHTLDSAEQATAALDALPEADRDVLLGRRLIAVAVEDLRKIVDPSTVGAETIPRTWTSWLRRLLDDPKWHAPEAVAACGELEYSADDLADSSAADELPKLVLAVADSARRQTLRDVLPRIVGWLERQDVELSAARPIHAAVLTVVALDTGQGESSLEVAYNATEALLRSGLEEHEYAELLDQLELLWERMTARAYVTWLADLFELLELYPGPRDPLVGFMASTARTVLAFADQLDASVVQALSRSCAAIGAQELGDAIVARAGEANQPAQIAIDALKDRLIGIYTLTPQVAVRAREAIQRRFPGVRVEVDSSLASTQSLEHLAATADYLIVSIRSAKHAATDAIDRHRPRSMPTLIPRGRGSSRMVEALVAAVESGPPA